MYDIVKNVLTQKERGLFIEKILKLYKEEMKKEKKKKRRRRKVLLICTGYWI